MKRILLFAAYLCTCLEDRGWSFAISLCMHALGGMQLVSIEQLVGGLAQIAFSGALGRAVDLKSERKFGMTLCLMGNNFSMICSSILLLICLSVDRSQFIYTISLLCGLMLCSAFRVFVIAERNILARDWAVVLVQERGELNRGIAKTNAILTSLDQIANVVSPLILGAFLTFVNLQTAFIILAGCSATFFILKATLLILLYERTESLRVKKEAKPLQLLEKTVVGEDQPKRPSSRISSTFSVLATYYAQPVYPAALGLALLYMTVLGFNGLDIAYGESIGLPEAVLGFFRSFGSVAGVAGALLYAVFERHFGVRKIGLFGMITHVSVLTLCVLSIWLPGSPWNPGAYFSTLTFSSWWRSFIGTFIASYKPASNSTRSRVMRSSIDWSTMTTSEGSSVLSILTYLVAIAASRFGLWMTDLAITHIMQISTPESQRNTVFGVQNAICKTFSVMKDLLVILLPSPHTFGICILLSYAFKCAGCLSYVYYITTSVPVEEPKKVDEQKEAGGELAEATELKPLRNDDDV